MLLRVAVPLWHIRSNGKGVWEIAASWELRLARSQSNRLLRSNEVPLTADT